MFDCLITYYHEAGLPAGTMPAASKALKCPPSVTVRWRHNKVVSGVCRIFQPVVATWLLRALSRNVAADSYRPVPAAVLRTRLSTVSGLLQELYFSVIGGCCVYEVRGL